MNEVVVAIHQPNTLPWAGYFAKILLCDAFVLLDDVAFSKGSYTNRAQLRGPDGPYWLTVPVKTAKNLGQRVRDVAIAERPRWADKVLRRVAQDYARAPAFAELFPAFEHSIRFAAPGLSAFNIHGIETVMSLLAIRKPLHLASSLREGGGDLPDLVRRVGGTTYLSGAGGRAYIVESTFVDAGVRLLYQDHREQVYSQIHGEFRGGLSIWDALFNLGPERTASLLSDVAAGFPRREP